MMDIDTIALSVLNRRFCNIAFLSISCSLERDPLPKQRPFLPGYPLIHQGTGGTAADSQPLP